MQNAESVTISPALGLQPAQSSTEVAQERDGTYTYTLVAENEFGTASEEVTLRVGEGPVISDFTATPEQLEEGGGDVELSWEVSEGTVRLTLDDARDDIDSGADNRNVTGSDSFTVRNLEQSLVFTLTATDDRGTTTSRNVTVVVGDSVPPQVTRFEATPPSIEAGESSELSWTVTGNSPVEVKISGDDGFSDTFTGSGSTSVSPASTTTYTLAASNEDGRAEKRVTVTVRDTPPPGGVITLLIAGQSNASSRAKLVNLESPDAQVRMLGNDYLWKQATEPTDSNENQVDTVSEDNGSGFDFGAGHSFGVKLGKELTSVTGEPIYLIQSAKAGSCVDDPCGSKIWRPDSLSRDTLFGSAVYRAKVSSGEVSNPSGEGAEGGPVTGIIWYQGESDQSNSGFIEDTNAVMDAFMTQLDRPGDSINGVPVIFVQLAQRLESVEKNRNYQSVREKQRRMETNFGIIESKDRNGKIVDSRRDAYYMVVAHDLPMDDENHLSTEGQKLLGERIALAYQEHVLGRTVDGTGPRLVSLERDEKVIKVKTTQTINRSSTYEGYFTVFVGGASKTLEDGIKEIRRDPSDDTAVRITLDDVPEEGALVSVQYMPPNPAPASYPTAQLSDAVRSQASGLPLPAFGPLAVDE